MHISRRLPRPSRRAGSRDTIILRPRRLSQWRAWSMACDVSRACDNLPCNPISARIEVGGLPGADDWLHSSHWTTLSPANPPSQQTHRVHRVLKPAIRRLCEIQLPQPEPARRSLRRLLRLPPCSSELPRAVAAEL